MLTIPISLNHGTDAKFQFNLDSGIMLTEVNEDPDFVNLFFVFPLLFLHVARLKVYVHLADLFNSENYFIRQQK